MAGRVIGYVVTISALVTAGSMALLATGILPITWSGSSPFFAVMVAVIPAILVPYLQRKMERADERALRDITAAAFGLQLLPRVTHVLTSLEEEINDIDTAVARDPDAAMYSSGSAYFKESKQIADDWRELQDFEPKIARSLIAAIFAIRAGQKLVDVDNTWPYEVDGEVVSWEIPVADTAALAELRAHYVEALRLLHIVKPALESLIKNSAH